MHVTMFPAHFASRVLIFTIGFKSGHSVCFYHQHSNWYCH